MCDYTGADADARSRSVTPGLPECTVVVPLARTHRVFLWRIPGG
jgi:hypothetical protein